MNMFYLANNVEMNFVHNKALLSTLSVIISEFSSLFCHSA